MREREREAIVRSVLWPLLSSASPSSVIFGRASPYPSPTVSVGPTRPQIRLIKLFGVLLRFRGDIHHSKQLFLVPPNFSPNHETPEMMFFVPKKDDRVSDRDISTSTSVLCASNIARRNERK
ncbi:hypothetical protein FRC18_005487 [Serendipita sp. 400]|nr:hypothetical protein FRC18_005487 [Serendipita sp. 400]